MKTIKKWLSLSCALVLLTGCMAAGLDKLTQEKKYQIVMGWFGSGASYNIGGNHGISFEGFYDPKALYALDKMQTDGLGKLAGWEEEQIKVLVDEIHEDAFLKMDDELKTACEKIILGGYQLVDIDNAFKVNNVSEFLNAIISLDRIIDDSRNINLPEGIHVSFFLF